MIKNKFIIFIMMLLMIGTVNAAAPNPTEFSEGLVITLQDWDEHLINTNLTLHSHIYNAKTGILLAIDEANCTIDIHKLTDSGYEHWFEMNSLYKGEMTLISTIFNETGSYSFDLSCFDVATVTMGGFRNINYEIVEPDISTAFGLWKPVEDWTFPGIYLIITALLLMLALVYQSQIIGVFGSIMLIMAYFLIGATSPMLFAPLLIVGLLLTFKFSTI